MRNVAPASDFYRITVGDGDVVWLMHVDRTSRSSAENELAYWQGLFGDRARLDTLTGGEDIVVRHMALAIQSIARDGCGVTRDLLLGLGFAADVVARRYTDALALVTASVPQTEAEPLPSNVVRLLPKPRAVR